MRKNLKRIAVLSLALLMVCILGAVVFAADVYYEEDYVSKTFDTVSIVVGVGIKEYQADSYAKFQAATPSAMASSYFEGDMYLSYTYCPENAMRPSNYMTGSTSDTFSKTADGTEFVLSTGKLELSAYGPCVVLSATGKYVIDLSTLNSNCEYAPDPITVTFDY